MATKLAQRAYRHIRAKIECGELVENQALSELTLAKELGTSRTPVREAIRWLESEGVLTVVPKKGTYVRETSRLELAELYDLRLVLEPAAAAWAAERIDASQLAEIKHLLQQMAALLEEAVGGPPAQQIRTLQKNATLETKFHLQILRSAGNRSLLRIVSSFRILSRALGRRKDLPAEMLDRLRRAHEEHCAVVRALEQRDAEAARTTMAAHLQRGKESALAFLDWRDRRRAAAGIDLDDLSPVTESHLHQLESNYAGNGRKRDGR